MIKLELLKRTDRSLEIGFCKINRVLTAYVTPYDIGIPRDTYCDRVTDNFRIINPKDFRVLT